MTTLTPPILRWTRFKSDPHGTGSEKRSAQIKDLCESVGVAVQDMTPPPRVPPWQTYLAGLKTRIRFGPQASIDRAGVGLLGYRTVFYQEALARHKGARVLLWETTYDTVLPTLAKNAAFKIVAVPHNVESFVSEKAFADPRYDFHTDLRAEVARLGRADQIYTISKEEKWLLEANGLTPSYLPFFPQSSLERECLCLRESRIAQTQPDGSLNGPLLLLGSGINPATARGMRTQLSWLRSHAPAKNVIVAGPNTEQVLAEFQSPGVKLLGQVTREALVVLLQTCCALAIHTLGGAGAVTRIPEALLAGIPVIANGNAARDQHDTPGVHEYETAEKFLSLVNAVLPMPPAPPRPTKAESFFQAELLKLLQTSRSHA